MSQNKMSCKKIIFLAAIAAFSLEVPAFLRFGALLLGGKPKQSFLLEKDEGMHEALKVLVDAGYCPSLDLCPSKELIFWAPRIDEGFSVFTYGITDQKSLNAISKIFLDQFYNVPDLKHVVIRSYRFSIEGDRAPFIKEWREGAMLDIDLKKNK